MQASSAAVKASNGEPHIAAKQEGLNVRSSSSVGSRRLLVFCFLLGIALMPVKQDGLPNHRSHFAHAAPLSWLWSEFRREPSDRRRTRESGRCSLVQDILCLWRHNISKIFASSLDCVESAAFGHLVCEPTLLLGTSRWQRPQKHSEIDP